MNKDTDKEILRNTSTGWLAQKSSENYRIIVYDRYGRHIGSIEPSQGVVDEALLQKNRRLKW